jgi:hypothetical protein
MPFIVCPKRGESRVDLTVCLGVCESKDECEEFKEVPDEDLQAARDKLNKSPAVIEDQVFDDGGEGEEIIVGEPAPRGGKDGEEASALLQKAISIKNEIEGKFWEMGSILNDIFKNQYYVDYGYHDWKDFCNEVLEMKWRTATYLRDIYVKFTSLGFGPEDCVGVGWGKLKELLPIVTKQNVKHWLEMAKSKKVSVAVLNAKVKLALGKITPDQSENLPSQLVFRLYEQQLENVERTLEIARKMTGSDSRGYQLEMICAEFRATYEAVEGDYTKSRLAIDLIKKVETLFGVTFKGDVIDAYTGEILREA